MMDSIKTFWLKKNNRERLMLAACAVICCVYLFYAWFYSPITDAVENNLKQFTEKKATLAWMQQMQLQYKGMKKSQTVSSVKFLTLLAADIKHSTFSQFSYQLQQTGANNIQLSFDQVPFNAFIAWLYKLNEQYFFSIDQLKIEQSNISGLVKAMVLFNVNTR